MKIGEEPREDGSIIKNHLGRNIAEAADYRGFVEAMALFRDGLHPSQPLETNRRGNPIEKKTAWPLGRVWNHSPRYILLVLPMPRVLIRS
jgi:hypothetical protein